MADGRVDALREFEVFEALGRRELQRIADDLSERSFPAGTPVAREGEVGVGFFLIEEGRASVTVGGREIGRLGPGDHFGEISLILDTPRTATVTAETDLRCWGMTSWEFRKLVESNAAISWKVLESTALKLRDAQRP